MSRCVPVQYIKQRNFFLIQHIQLLGLSVFSRLPVITNVWILEYTTVKDCITVWIAISSSSALITSIRSLTANNIIGPHRTHNPILAICMDRDSTLAAGFVAESLAIPSSMINQHAGQSLLQNPLLLELRNIVFAASCHRNTIQTLAIRHPRFKLPCSHRVHCNWFCETPSSPSSSTNFLHRYSYLMMIGLGFIALPCITVALRVCPISFGMSSLTRQQLLSVCSVPYPLEIPAIPICPLCIYFYTVSIASKEELGA